MDPETEREALKEMRLSVVIDQFADASKTDKRYFLSDYDGMSIISNWLHSIPLSIADRYVINSH